MRPRDQLRRSPASTSARLRGESVRPCKAFRRPRAYLLVILFAFSPASRALAEQDLTLFLTCNLQGRFSPEAEGQDIRDPFLLIARGMIEERKARNTLYLDLGNAFYPGPLSKFSYGSVVMEYFEALSCAATLVSSNDLRIGMENLEALQREKGTKLLSANLLRDRKPLFLPYTIRDVGGTSLAVIGISSDEVVFDIAERNLYNVAVQYRSEEFAVFLREVKSRGADYILLLSGLSLKKTLALLSDFGEIDLAICGGDNPGEIYSSPASRVEMADGRSIVLLPESDGYSSLDLVLEQSGMRVTGLRRRSEAQLQSDASDLPPPLDDSDYVALSDRLRLWKGKFRQEGETVLATTGGKPSEIDDRSLSFLLRDRFDAEVSLVEAGAIHRSVWHHDVSLSDVIVAVNQDFNLFVYGLTGKQLKKVKAVAQSLLINGLENNRVQGYRVEAKRKYRVVSTQATFDRVERILGKQVPYKNSWITVTDLLKSDLQGEGVIFRDNYDYLDRRFRTTVDFSLSNYFDHASVSKGADDDTPPGWPSDSYSQWGLENEIKVVVYNRRHQVVFLPYICYRRTTDIYLKNMLRGSILYNYNTQGIAKPYFKSQVETVLEDVAGRPVVIRETLGAYFTPEKLTAKLGAGFEKKVKDPSEDAFYGIEAQANLKLPLWDKIVYTLDVDSFVSIRSFADNDEYIRAEIVNGVSVPLVPHLYIGFKHKWFFYRSPDSLEDYSSSQVLTTLDLKMDAKLW